MNEFSEIETNNILELTKKYNFDSNINFFSTGNEILIPLSTYTKYNPEVLNKREISIYKDIESIATDFHFDKPKPKIGIAMDWQFHENKTLSCSI